jgi:disulfide oxidoreductase YuzD
MQEPFVTSRDRKRAGLRRLAPVVSLLATAPWAVGQTTANIQTHETFIQLRTQDHNPQLLSLGKWRNQASEELIDSVTIEGNLTAVTWKFNAKASVIDHRRVAFIYDCTSPQLRLTWEWTAPALTGPIEHTIHIQNRSGKELWLPLQNSYEFNFQTNAEYQWEHFYVEKGAGKPSPVGTHLDPTPAGYRWTGTSSTYAHPAEGQPREIIPFFAVQESESQTGWYTGIEFSGRTRLSLQRDQTSINGTVGLNPDPGPFRTCLKPNETFDTPTVFIGGFTGGVDGLGNVLRPWVRRVLGNPETWRNPSYPLLVNNSWGSGMQVDETLARQMIRDSADLGLEMFHIDAGWFRGVGDWFPDPKKFPRGLAAIADEAHRYGLKFGLWCDWAQATATRDWMVSDLPADWKPDAFKSQTIDIGDPAAHAYAKQEVFRIVEDYKLDMLEHDGYVVAQGCVRTDHPHAPPDLSRMSITKDQGSYFVESSNSTDVSYHATRAYYDIYRDLRKRHPRLLLEICNDGGRMVDFGSAAHGDYFSITDSYDPLSNRQAFYDASHLLPPAMLEAYVEKWPTPKIENFRYMLRSGMMGWLTIMLDTSQWSAQERAVAKEEIQLYKTELRPLIRDADLYHISARPDGVHCDGIEYFDPRRGKGAVYAFRGSGEEREHRFVLRGLVGTKQYRLRFHDHNGNSQVMTGRDLMTTGLTVVLLGPDGSELILIESARAL